MRATLLASLGMAVAFTGAVFAWFAPAVADYTGWPPAAALAALLLAAPLLQPQFVAFALLRRLASRRCAATRAGIAIAAWLACEWALPRLFGDTLGHGLHPSTWMRQFADVAGAAGLTLLLLAVNEALAAVIAQVRCAPRRAVAPLCVAVALPALVAAYGAWRLSTLDGGTDPPLRVGLVQANIVDYERLRREHGSHAVVRHVLDTHYAMSRQAREVDRVDALLWSETVYPTTFLQPRSVGGAALDAEILAFVRELGTPLVFGTYARDEAGEYNVAAFVDPRDGPLGAYRKTRLFPLTEHVPPALDGPALRAALPWAGTWQPGDGPRVFPLRTDDGREVPVLPLICRDDVDPGLAIAGARLGARLIVGLSNDSWFTRHPEGARLHLAVAAFRSIETRLPQVRATTNGISAVVDASGAITARTRMGERALLVAQVRPRDAAYSPVMRLGPWLGPACALVLLGFAALGAHAAWRRRHPAARAPAAPVFETDARALLLAPWQRVSIAGLRVFSRGAVLVLAAAALAGDEAMQGMLRQLRLFAVLVLAPETAAFALAWLASARLRIGDGHLVLDTRRRRIEIPLPSLARAQPWRLPLPSPGLALWLGASGRWPQDLALRNPTGLVDALMRAGAVQLSQPVTGPRHAALLQACAQPRHWLDRVVPKFLVFPLVPALPAFRLHQHIAYGSSFGELHTFGAAAYFSALGLWWASWAVALVLLAGALRALVEAATAIALALRPAQAARVRTFAWRLARLVYYLGVPGWLLLRLLGG